MKNNKKTMLISWLIGLGTGFFISGIALIILLYNVNNISNHNNNAVKVIEKQEETPAESLTEEEEEEDSKSDIIEAKDNNIEEDLVDSDPNTIIVEIGETATAREIAALLEEKDIVEDGQAFLEYVVSKKAARKLIHGSKVFNLNSDNAAALEVLMTYR